MLLLLLFERGGPAIERGRPTQTQPYGADPGGPNDRGQEIAGLSLFTAHSRIPMDGDPRARLWCPFQYEMNTFHISFHFIVARA
jgi:hypothetical protein